jgi:hypothetical protein
LGHYLKLTQPVHLQFKNERAGMVSSTGTVERWGERPREPRIQLIVRLARTLASPNWHTSSAIAGDVSF